MSVSPDFVHESLLTASHKMKLRLLSLTNETSPDHPCAPYSLAPCRPAQLSPPASQSLPVPAHLGPPQVLPLPSCPLHPPGALHGAGPMARPAGPGREVAPAPQLCGEGTSLHVFRISMPISWCWAAPYFSLSYTQSLLRGMYSTSIC